MKKLLLLLSLTMISPVSQAQSNIKPMSEDAQHIQRWNKFFNSLLDMHKQYLHSHEIETTESLGGYAGLPKFYREVRYSDKKTHRLLSRIQWEQKKPHQAHTVEIFAYDDQGRIDRDYLAAYLPRSRNAPIQTLINLHHYSGDLHSYRQFDASGNRIYEHCERGAKNQHILIQMDEDAIIAYHNGLNKSVNTKTYQQCFAGLEETAVNYLQPF